MTLKTVFRWHVWLGLLTGLFLFLIGFTGAVAVFAPEIEWMVTPGMRVEPAADGKRVDAEAIIASLQAQYPGARINRLEFSVRPHFAHEAALSVRQPNGKSRGVTAYVDPATGAVTGERAPGGGYTSTIYQFIRQSHVRLLMGAWGRMFVGVFGVTLMLSCATGLWIYRGWIKKLFQLRLKGSWGTRPPWAELHKFIGVWSLVFNLMIGFTGAVFGLEGAYVRIEKKWFSSPSAATAPADSAEGGEMTEKPGQAAKRLATGPVLGANELLARARAAFPDFTVRTMTIPAKAGTPAVMTGDVPSMLVAQSHVRRRNSLRLDPVTGDVLSKVDGREDTGWNRIYWAFDPIHFGYFGGLFTKVIWFILGMTPSFLALSGAWMWWRRRAHAAQPARPSAQPAASASPAVRWIGPVIGVATLTLAYAVVAKDANNWAFTHRLAEHWLVKPVTLALIAFPVTAPLCWLLWRWRNSAMLHAGVCVLLGGWYIYLTGLFIR